MAPRRQKKVGLKRIDAAIDALLPCGFSKKTICETIKKLLEVYGGDAAWPIIEEDTYRMVIEYILEEQEQEARKEETAREQAKRLEGPSQVAEADEEAGFDMDHGPEQNTNGQSEPTLAAEAAEAQSNSGKGSHRSLTDQPTSPRPKRLPCYGWISEDEDEPQGLSDVTFDYEPERPHRSRKRPRGWDIMKPSDM